MKPISVLSDGTIRRLLEAGRLRIEPWEPDMLQPASVDLKLGRSFRVFHNHRIRDIDLLNPPRDLTELVEVENGEQFVIHPGEFVLGSTAEEVELADDLVARIEGKALALDTRVPMPDGWTTMGEIEVADEVFDPYGNAIPVVAVSDVQVDRPCFRVSFSDGTTVTADAAHQWEVQTKHDRKTGRRRVLRTDEIGRTLWVDHTRKEYRYRVAQAEPVHYPSRELPIDPYVLGVWIGDGTSAAAERSTGTATKRALLERIDLFPRAYPARMSRSIVGVEPVKSVPVRCIEVGTARGAYLVTDSFITTHNSSLGRLGLIVHATAGFVDPGFKGSLTLEITNFNSVPIVLRPGLPIAQLSLMGLDAPAERPYGHPELGSHYQAQTDATESRYEGGPARRGGPTKSGSESR